MGEVIWTGAVMGFFATAAMDLWGLLLNRTAGFPALNFAMLGRWAVHVSQGRVAHANIAASKAVGNENAIGWFVHYAIGVVFGVIFALFMGRLWLDHPTLLPALVFGVATVGCGWFLLSPLTGAGWANSRAPNRARVRLRTVTGHVVFGLVLWLAALTFN